jgi:hypothetical protein
MNVKEIIKYIMSQRGVAFEEVRRCPPLACGGAGRECEGGRFPAKAEIVLADGRLVVLILPAGRRVIPGRVGKLLGADLVSLLPEIDEKGSLADYPTDVATITPCGCFTTLMDASMLSARHLVLAVETVDESIRLKFEDWYALVRPGLGFFTEPEHASS